jgi:hypothetical protein
MDIYGIEYVHWVAPHRLATEWAAQQESAVAADRNGLGQRNEGMFVLLYVRSDVAIFPKLWYIKPFFINTC